MKIFVVGVSAAMLLERVDAAQAERRLERGGGRQRKPPDGQVDGHGELDRSPGREMRAAPVYFPGPGGDWNKDFHPQRLIAVARCTVKGNALRFSLA